MSFPIRPFDWHEQGLWCAFDPKGEPVPGTMATTPYSARAELLRTAERNPRGLGYTIRQLVPTVHVEL